MTCSRSLYSMLVALAACGSSDKVGPDAGSGENSDASALPTLTVLISKDGSDLHDGIDKPVETLRRAIEIATANPRVTDIVLAAGNYTIRGGEAFPYKIPANVAISGPTGGGAVLVGSGTEAGLIFTGGQLQNVALDNFGVAIEAAGELRLKSLKITNSGIALHGAGAAKLRIDGIDISGPAFGPCAIGIRLEGELFATTVTTHNLGPALEAINPGPVDIAMGTFVGLSTCQRPMLEVVSATKSFRLSDSTIEGGALGINLVGEAMTVQATITNSSVRGATSGMRIVGMSLQMLGGAIADNGFGGFEGGDGLFSFNGVSITNNRGGGVEVHGTAIHPTILVMRHCSLLSNTGNGIVVGDTADADLGTAASPGGNFMTSNGDVNLNLNGQVGQGQVDAVGNTWGSSTQGSNVNGNYWTQVIQGPVPVAAGNNFALGLGWSIQL